MPFGSLSYQYLSSSRIFKVSGNYAKWWFITRQHRDVTDLEIAANPQKYIGDFGTPVDEFNSLCMTSCCFLCAALMLSILTLSTGSTNVFTREQDHYYGHQYRVVMKSYMFWVSTSSIHTCTLCIYVSADRFPKSHSAFVACPCYLLKLTLILNGRFVSRFR